MRRALTFVLPVLLIAGLTWYLVQSAFGNDTARSALPAEPVPTTSNAGYPPAWPYHGSATTAAEEVELCGHGPVPIDAVPADLERAADAVVLRRAEAQQRSSSASERMLGYATAAMVAWSQVYVRAHQVDPGCSTRLSCVDKAKLDAARAAVPAAEGLARLAVTSRDPAVYATALAACRHAALAPEINVCSALRAEQWALLDPDNGQAWLEVARAALQRKDTRAIDEAMLRASRTRSVQYPVPPFFQLLSGQLPPADAVEALAIVRVLDVYGRWLGPVVDPGMLQGHCSPQTMVEPGRKSLCADLAVLLTEKDGSLLGMLIGTHIGERAGWGAERVAAQRSRLRAMSDAVAREQPGRDVLTCDGAARAKSWLTEVQRAGEVAYARRMLAGGDTMQARR